MKLIQNLRLQASSRSFYQLLKSVPCSWLTSCFSCPPLGLECLFMPPRQSNQAKYCKIDAGLGVTTEFSTSRLLRCHSSWLFWMVLSQNKNRQGCLATGQCWLIMALSIQVLGPLKNWSCTSKKFSSVLNSDGQQEQETSIWYHDMLREDKL